MTTEPRKKSVSIHEDVEKEEKKQEKKYTGKDRFKESWKVPIRYDVRKMLGSGAYGQVCEAQDKEKNCRVAIKQAGHLMDDLIDAKRILREIAILGKLDHPHLVKCYDVFVPEGETLEFDEIYIVLEIADSDMKKLVRASVHLNPVHINSLMYNLLTGLNYLHSAGIWHRDLKPANCLVNEDCSVKICDYGLARAVGGEAAVASRVGVEENEEPHNRRFLTGHVVTRWYRAPELILLQENYTEAIDIWSVGCIYAELMGMREGVRFKDRAPLFPGHSCFPLSPTEGHKKDAHFYTNGTRDQLSTICDLIGTPSADDVARLLGADAQAYMRAFKPRTGGGIANQFGKFDPVGTLLLEQLLVFNPAKRITSKQAMEHDTFNKIRNPKSGVEAPATSLVSLDFETEEELGEPELRKLFMREVYKYHPEKPET